jgi:small subunit ribosomal protein S1
VGYPESPDWAPDEDYWRALIEQDEAPLGEPGASMPAGVPAKPPVFAPDAPRNGSYGVPTFNGDTAGLDVRRVSKGRDDATWSTLMGWKATGQTVIAPVIGCNKGGLLVRVGDGLGFVPASQLRDLPRSLGTSHLRDDLESMVGREIALRLIEVDRDRDRVICSERATLWQGAEVGGQLEALQRCLGCEVEGIVRSLCDFGAFVDLGGVDGLIHISELSWQRVEHPSDVVAVDQVVRVKVLNVDFVGRRVGLSLKQLHPDPWQLVGAHYRVGDVIDAVITNVVHFGAFARVDEGIEGLIHISELSDSAFTEPGEVVSENLAVRARILHIDPDARRLGLSMRQA